MCRQATDTQSPLVADGNAIDLWLIRIVGLDADGALTAASQVLCPAEIGRAHSFQREIDRREYVIARAFLRGVLAQYLHQTPASIQFDVGPFGKPMLAKEHRCWNFNLTHGGGFVAVAVRYGLPVGIDIESIQRDIDVARIAQLFAKSESERIIELDGERQREAFWTVWTLKEAYVKARGQGLSLPLDSFSIEFTDDGVTPFRLRPTIDDPVQDWWLDIRRPHSDVQLALASPIGDKAGLVRVNERALTPKELYSLWE